MGKIGNLMMIHREAIMYVLFGGFTTLVTWGTYFIFANWCSIEINLSNILSWVCGVLFAFVVNKWFVFQSRSNKANVVVRELGFFIGARIFTGIVAWVLFPILLFIGLDQMILNTPGMVAKIIVSVVEIALNWIFSKYLVFAHKNKVKEEV